MSTFLELVQTTASECGASGSIVTLSGVTGESQRIMRWVRDADVELQGRWFDWDFMHVSDWFENTVVGVANVSAPTDLGMWDKDSFYLDYTSATHSKLEVLDYNLWRKLYRQGVKTNQRPSNVVIKPDRSLILESPPDAVYLLTGDYWKAPVRMEANGDTSLIPVEFERIIVSRAKLYYAEYEAAGEIFSGAQIEFDDLLDKLESKYLPHQEGRRKSDAGMMVVSPE